MTALIADQADVASNETGGANKNNELSPGDEEIELDRMQPAQPRGGAEKLERVAIDPPDKPSVNASYESYTDLVSQYVSNEQWKAIEEEVKALREAGMDFPVDMDALLEGPPVVEWEEVQGTFLELMRPPESPWRCRSDLCNELERDIRLKAGLQDLVGNEIDLETLPREQRDSLETLNEELVAEVKTAIEQDLVPAYQAMFDLAWSSECLIRLPRWRTTNLGFHANAPRATQRACMRAMNLEDWLVILDVPNGKYPFYDQVLFSIGELAASRITRIREAAASF